MLRMALTLTTALTLATAVLAADADKGLQPGDPLGVFFVTKVAGGEDDKMQTGDEVCYRCRYGSKPMVIVFTRDTGKQVAALTKALESAVEPNSPANEKSELYGLLALLGEDISGLKDAATTLEETTGAKHIPLTVAKDNLKGPANYQLGDHDVTIVLGKENQIVSSHAFAKASEMDIAAIVKAVQELKR